MDRSAFTRIASRLALRRYLWNFSHRRRRRLVQRNLFCMGVVLVTTALWSRGPPAANAQRSAWVAYRAVRLPRRRLRHSGHTFCPDNEPARRGERYWMGAAR
jgi:hypothetical protein